MMDSQQIRQGVEALNAGARFVLLPPDMRANDGVTVFTAIARVLSDGNLFVGVPKDDAGEEWLACVIGRDEASAFIEGLEALDQPPAAEAGQ